MDQPCELGSIHTGELKGTETKIGDIDVYIREPSTEKNLGTAIIVIHDIYGFQIPNTKLRGDFLADNGHYAVVPDLYHGDSWNTSRGATGVSEAFQQWRAAIPEDRVISDIETIVKHLKETKGIKKVGAIGFCWGGSIVNKIALAGLIDAGVAIHGGGVDANVVEETKCPLFFVVAGTDRHVTSEHVERTRKAITEHPDKQCDIKVWPNRAHGWVNRGNYEDPEEKQHAEEALADTNAYLVRILGGK